MILAIDPGNTESAYVVIDDDCTPIRFGKVDNGDLLGSIEEDLWRNRPDRAVIEMVGSYGMAVGADVFETCVWIGRFQQELTHVDLDAELVKRHPVKLHHCHSAKAKDGNIAQALIDRFASGEPNRGKGTKAKPGWFYGFHSDIWQAYALAVYAADTGVSAHDQAQAALAQVWATRTNALNEETQ